MRPEQTAAVPRQTLHDFFSRTLEPALFKDYCPNGLQVEGAGQVSMLVTGVTASLRFLEAAEQAGADAVLVHHGWFWRGEDACLVGAKMARLKVMIRAEMSLFAYHLPLDAHPELGNNVQLANQLGWSVAGRAGRDGLVFYTDLTDAISARQLTRKLTGRLGQKPLIVGEHAGLESPALKRIAWCTGGAQDAIDTAIELGADAYLSGEISERTTHIAREAGLLYVSAGHHATERFGVQALGEHAARALGVQHRFIDDPNPV
ncbi:MAG: Nif3-like dinuclear metal center hexameric protein [Burkholderiaceae bacterium]